MGSLSIPALAIISVLLGGVLAWLALRARSAVLRERVSTLDRSLAVVQEELRTVNSNNSDLKAEVAGLNSTLQEERKTSVEKLQLLNTASAELRQAFQALAADALSSNNESFLQLARTRLDKYQAEAKGDLEARQKAVEGVGDADQGISEPRLTPKSSRSRMSAAKPTELLPSKSAH